MPVLASKNIFFVTKKMNSPKRKTKKMTHLFILPRFIISTFAVE